MSIGKTIAEQMEHASWIRRMFEIGARLKRERGEENVFDFTLGNPDGEPPEQLISALRRVVETNRPRSHAYMPNAGFAAVREVIARQLSQQTGLGYTADHILMTVGASGAINVVLKSLLDPGDEVIILVPFFPEYQFYIENHAGRMLLVETDDSFQPNLGRIAAAITPRTKAIILNSPNNPTGAVYSTEFLRELEGLISSLDHPVTVIADEPYKALIFDGLSLPVVPSLIRRTVVTYSWSKALAIPGERIGYLALSPLLPELNSLRDACTFANRILGYINAPAVWQCVMVDTANLQIDPRPYQEKRDLLWKGLTRLGYEVTKPQGTFYMFPKTPIADDLAFVRGLMDQGILAVPGSGFGRSGYIRLSLTIPMDSIERSLPGFARALR
ncbi:MAG TPA: pyridoxal phosphate-dependent aminotransferase [Terriglobia bacterium]|nr:pyridoxal phosphate-dependent aminotransferase [Terriglobia bacterium]